MKAARIAFSTCVLTLSCTLHAATDALTKESVFGFESGSLIGWEITEGSFQMPVSSRTLFFNSGQPYNNKGNHFLSTLDLKNGQISDAQVGIIESIPFTLLSDKVSLLVGGGSQGVYVALCDMDGNERFKAHGRNDEVMVSVEWDVTPLVGEKVFLRVVDHNPGGWGHIVFDAFEAEVEFDPEIIQAKRVAVLEAQFAATFEPLRALGRAVQDLRQNFGDRYNPGLPEVVDAVLVADERYERLLAEGLNGDPNALGALQKLVRELTAHKDTLLLANPLVRGQAILFVQRHQYKPDHHNTGTLFQAGEINEASYTPPGRLMLLDPVSGDSEVLVDAGEQGLLRDPEISWNGEKIVFSMRKQRSDAYNIYTIEVDGSDLTQLTSLEGVSNVDPVFLPDGNIIFSATRDPKYCMCNRHIMANLYRMESDGANIHQISKNTLFDLHSSIMQDGRILYSRWEYVDRNYGDAQGLWTCNPDGTMHQVYYGNNTASPDAVIDPRQIPGTDLVVCIFTSCHDRPWGAMAIIDRSKGVDGEAPVTRIWPESARELIIPTGWNIDHFMHNMVPRYEDPFPLADPESLAGAGKYFLCAYTPDSNQENTGIYLVDIFGNQVLVYQDPAGFGSFDPMPVHRLKTVDRPKVQFIETETSQMPAPLDRPIQRKYDDSKGYFYVQNVYEGNNMEGIAPGEIKALRVVETPEKLNWSEGQPWIAQGFQFPATNWHSFEIKKLHGVVPVEPDGSAYFEAPTEKFIYFQLLDEDGKVIQSMRSGAVVQPGEVQSCIGCHDNRNRAPATTAQGLLALDRAPSKMGEGIGSSEIYSYLENIQPIWDKHCVSCHDFESGQEVILAGDKEAVFNTSYAEIWKHRLVNVTGGGLADLHKAKSWGSHASKLVNYLDNHYDVHLSDAEKRAVYEWIDLNAVYYPTFDSAYTGNPTGRSPLTAQELLRLAQLCQFDLNALLNNNIHPGAFISYDRPEKSPCLDKLAPASPQYAEALSLIKEGQRRLVGKPRGDMPGFEPAENEQERIERYNTMREIEGRFREAIIEGEKLYDKDL